MRRNTRTGVTGLLLFASLVSLGAQSSDQSKDLDELQEIVVYGREERLIGIVSAASEGTVGGADLAVRPLLRVAEILEAVPGLIAAQHSGSGKANQYFLRGFNLDHGTDFAAYFDDVPLNLRTHGHGQGYLDVNGLIPELVDRIDFRKGPYRADTGDNALAGASFLSSVPRIADPFAGIEVGQYGWRRVAGGGTTALGDGELTLAGQWKSYDGPWELPENLQHVALYAKYSQPTFFGRLEASWWSYNARWDPTEQIPERAIGTSICEDEFCALDTSATGVTDRQIATLRLIGDDWHLTLYSQYYDWNMYSDATYDFQIRQWDRRFVSGARGQRLFEATDTLFFTVGGDTRYDDIHKVQVDHTDQRQFIDYVSAHSANELSVAAFGEGTWRATDTLRVTAGLRADYFDFHTHATQPGFGAGDVTDSIVSPKLAVAWQVNDFIETYANWGRGYHSNDARGVTASDPPVPGLVKGEGEEVGARYQHGPLSLTATYWWLDVDSELKFVGDSNSVEPGAASARRGYELVGFLRPLPWIAIDASWTVSHARYVDSPGAEFIPGAIESAGELGVSMIKGPWELSGRLRHLGPYPLVDDNSLRASGENVVNFRAAWKSDHWMVYGEVLNLFNRSGKDIVYYYESYLAAIDAAPTEGRMSRVEEPRTLRFGLRYNF